MHVHVLNVLYILHTHTHFDLHTYAQITLNVNSTANLNIDYCIILNETASDKTACLCIKLVKNLVDSYIEA